MEITFTDSRLQDRCESQAALLKAYGRDGARKVMARLADLRAAETLEEMRQLAGKCHELKADRHGQLAINLDGPRRLVFTPEDNDPPLKPDGGLDWSRVSAIRIIEIVDYH